MNSDTWLVTTERNRYVAKSVDHAQRPSFEAGLAAAAYLSRHQIAAGDPLRAIDGALSVTVGDYAVALLSFVDGRPLDRNDPVDQLWWGDRLAACHHALRAFAHPGLPTWHWLRADAVHLGLENWLRPAVGWAVSGLERLQVVDRLTFGVLHGDPYHGAFLLDPDTGRVGVIDWGSALAGPLMYDVASAVMYAGGAARAGDLLHAYASAGVLAKAEIEASLPAFLRFRWAVQADYFAQRVTRDPSPENLKGLNDAKESLLG
jgi:Ser/Thr protein kinase RdoA (MazF antagonist)